MANFLQNGSDKLGPMQLYRPDYSFLTKVYGAKQDEFNKGANIVKSVYTSSLNDILSNPENIAHRDDMFKKLQDSIKSISNTDLSKSQNVTQALSLLDPVAKDKELVYDRHLTQKNNQTAQLMESYKNSPDPAKRRQYNDYSAMSVQFSNEDLKNAKRGDGSIMNVEAGKFIPFEDMNAFLDAQALEQDLEIKKSFSQNGYIYEITNGEGAVVDFQMWAKTQLSGRFDEQLSLMGEMQAEQAIRTKMDDGMSRTDAISTYSKEVAPEIFKKNTERGIQLETELRKIDDKIDIYETLGKSKLEGNESYQNLLEQKKIYNEALLNKQQDVYSQQTEGDEFVMRNLKNIFATASFTQTADNWGKSKAMTKVNVEMKPDQVVINKLNRNSREKIAKNRLEMDLLKLEEGSRQADNANKLRLLELKSREKIAGKKLTNTKLDKKGNVIEEDLSTSRKIGNTLSVESLEGSEVVQNSYNNNNTKFYNAITNTENGLINMVVLKGSHKYIQALSKLKNSTGEDLDQSTKSTLAEYANKVGVGDDIGEDFNYTGKYSESALSLLLGASYETALSNSENFFAADVKNSTGATSSSFRDALESATSIASQREILYDQMEKIGEAIKDNPELYEGAEQIAISDGSPIYDISNISDEANVSLGGMIEKRFNDKRKHAGTKEFFQGIGAAETETLFNKTKIKSVIGITEDELDTYKEMDQTELSNYFGDNVNVSYFPVKEEAHFEFKRTVSGKTSKALKSTKLQDFTVVIPYSRIDSEPGLELFREKKNENTIDYTVQGRSYPLNSDYGTLESTQAQEANGFKFSAMRVGNTISCEFTITDQQTKEETSYRKTYQNITSSKKVMNALEEINKLESTIEEIANKKSQQ